MNIRIHLTNITGGGAGALQLLKSLLPAILNDRNYSITKMYLPAYGELSEFSAEETTIATDNYYRYMPNSISRLLECVFFSYRFNGSTPLLVLGDVPLRTNSPQIVFVQTPHLLKQKDFFLKSNLNKYWFTRQIFNFNQSRVSAFIVQSDWMKKRLEQSYPRIVGRVHIIQQPVPSWLLSSGLKRTQRIANKNRLTLFYPAVGYPHKNHDLLGKIKSPDNWPINELTLTLEEDSNPATQISWIRCIGFISPTEMKAEYKKTDALLFLSKQESYGLPLVEAMFIGLPIVCPDLPYAHSLCGNQAIYFDPNSQDSLFNALIKLSKKLENGWWPDWQDQLSVIPPDWETVAERFLNVVQSVGSVKKENGDSVKEV